MKTRTTATFLLVAILAGAPAICGAEEYQPDYARIRTALAKPTRLPARLTLATSGSPSPQTARVRSGSRDSIWNGLLIGAGVGATGGYVWARNECGDDDECAAITNPVGILAGAAIGAAVGALLDAFSW